MIKLCIAFASVKKGRFDVPQSHHCRNDGSIMVRTTQFLNQLNACKGIIINGEIWQILYYY